ncbi:MAG: molybdenum cofactor biosynthesis protein MoaE [Pseudomonadota bacterium]
MRVQSEAFDAGVEMMALQANDPSIGAVTSFVGYCRDEGGTLAALELEHFTGMAEAALDGIADKAQERWPLDGVTIIHRYGRILPGDAIVFVGTASAHRRASFEAADFIMDYLKTSAPFWKKEHPADKSKAASWVDAKTSDDEDAARWAYRGTVSPPTETIKG